MLYVTRELSYIVALKTYGPVQSSYGDVEDMLNRVKSTKHLVDVFSSTESTNFGKAPMFSLFITEYCTTRTDKYDSPKKSSSTPLV